MESKGKIEVGGERERGKGGGRERRVQGEREKERGGRKRKGRKKGGERGVILCTRLSHQLCLLPRLVSPSGSGCGSGTHCFKSAA